MSLPAQGQSASSQAGIVKLPKTGNAALDKELANLVRDLRPTLDSRLPKGHLVETVDANGNPTLWISLSGAIGKIIPHKLGRLPLGWLVVRKSAPADIYDTALDASSLTLFATANTKIQLWVFG